MSTSVPWATVAQPNQSQQPAGSGLRPLRNRARLLSELAEFIPTGPPTTKDVYVRGISSSSALVQPGDLFAALPGGTGHGIRFATQALAAGAVALLTDPAGADQLAELKLAATPTLVCADPRAVLGRLSAEIYGNPSRALSVVGITGTSGKTTTSYLVRAGLAAAGVESGLVGTVGIFLGDETVKTPFTTPEAPQLQALLAVMAERGFTQAVMEVSSHALRLGRVDGVEFSVGAFTNLSQDHLDFHPDMDDYFAAKAMLFDGRAARELVVVDDEWGPRLVTDDTVTVSGVGRDAHWRATDLMVDTTGATTFKVHGPGVEFSAGCRIPGSYNVTNTLLALAILAQLGVDPAAAAPALALAQVRGRMERVDGDQPFLAVVDYSHKPAGVSGALQALRPLTTGRLIIVLGCGGDRDRLKRPLMGEVAARDADVLIVTDDNPRSEDPALIRAAMLAGARSVAPEDSAEIIEIGDRGLAIERAIALAGPGDSVLVAGKGHETGQDVDGIMLAFDDVTVLRDCLLARGFGSDGSGSSAGASGSAVIDR